MANFDPGILHVGGYHGTDLSSAERISAEGFLGANGDVFFAPLDNCSLHSLTEDVEREIMEMLNMA